MSDAGTTAVLLSFPMREHGGGFAYWLRNRLMLRYAFAHVNSVYMDCVASRLHDSVNLKPTVQLKQAENGAGSLGTFIPMDQRTPGMTYVQYDPRPEFDSQGYHPIGATNSAWNEAYLKAMSEAAVMIMVVTPAYLTSPWCIKEWGQFRDENKRRLRQGRRQIIGSGIEFNQDTRALGALRQAAAKAGGFIDPDKRVINLEGVTWIRTNRCYNPIGSGCWHPKDYGMSEPELGRVFALTDQRVKKMVWA